MLSVRFLRRLFTFHSRQHFLFFLLGLVIVCAGGVQLWGWYEFSQAEKASQNFQLEAARQHIARCLWLWPTSGKVKVMAARIARLSGQFEEAEDLLRQCRTLNAHTSGTAQLEMLLMRAQKGELEAVAPFLWQCIEAQHPDSGLILETIARLSLSYDRYRDALICLEKELKLDPTSIWAHDLRGYAREAMNQKEGAIEDYEFILRQDPKRYSVRQRLCQIFVDLRQLDKALPQAKYLTRQDPGRPDGWVLLARCHYEQGQLEEAHRMIEQVLQQHSEHPETLLWGGIISFRLERYSEAKARLERAVKLIPYSRIAMEYWYRCLASQGDPKAEDLLKRLRKLRDCQTRLEEIQFKELSVSPLTLAERIEGGKLILDMDRKREGIHWLNLALQEDPKNEAVYRILIDYYRRTKDFDNADYHQKILDSLSAKAHPP